MTTTKKTDLQQALGKLKRLAYLLKLAECSLNESSGNECIAAENVIGFARKELKKARRLLAKEPVSTAAESPAS
jgi:hypothetical protein